ncbi:unnamed protein product [Paramecium pentaurelia]|uniref:Transmembrane protein n=1 Tax=Paramecium pentaurelia TaxID=43138 RepID=A0A8S1Y8I9_9CILI|nr:unnamed protein product [Paramecium pentaurelia]
MFAIGLGQFVIGCGICAFTCGVALPIGKALITEGKLKKLSFISESTASEILQLINLCSKQSQGTVEGFNHSLVQASLKFIKLQMAKAKSEKNVYEIKKDLVEICQREGNKKYDQLLIMNYKNFPILFGIILIKIKKSKKKLFFQIFIMNYSCDQQQVQKMVTNNMVQSHLQKYFSIHNKTVQNACNQLQISNPHSMNQFYQIVMRLSITQTLNDLRPQILYTEPLEIVFQQEYLNKFLSLQQQSKIMKNDLEIQQKELKYQQDLITRRIQKSSSEIMRINQAIDQFNFNWELIEQVLKDIKEIQNFQNQQFVKELIGNMKNKGMIYDDGISFSPKFQQEFKNFLMKQNFNKRMKDITQQAMESSLNLISKINQTSNKTLKNKLLEAIEVEMIDQVKKQIFDLRMQNADKKIISKFN